ncbi:MAG: hypothetical protein RI562_08500 [Salibacter sp.]|uniref:LA_2272 family surface repeat-containing protein n=1 Tax=Salibacter sp. TaxID=2010995 RepID=UPI00286FC2FC|nr:hypothetical protein [Salibacter sp.]MDR9399089.1 hypothetical protein [Salibacter sp.]
MPKPLTLLLFLFLTVAGMGQSASGDSQDTIKNYYGIRVIPSRAMNIYGIAIGPVGSEVVCFMSYTKKSHGLNIQIPGQGFNSVFMMKPIQAKALTVDKKDTIQIGALHNGLIVSPLGTFTSKINGVSLSGWMSAGLVLNGFSFNLVYNRYEYLNGISIGMVNHAGEMNGAQVGLVNNAAKLRGFQIGLWNTNQKRSLPLFNWCFEKE